MKSYQKLIHFFSSKYYNNLKFSNKMLATTRIFFERTTKTSHSLQALGNVYRNSKWSDLNVFNIKESSLKQFRTMSLLIFLTVLLLIFTSRFNLQWGGIIIYNAFEVIFYLKDITTSWVLFLVYTVSFLFIKIVYFFTKTLLIDIIPKDMNSPQVITKKTNHLIQSSPKTQGLKDNGLLLTSLYLQKMSKYLHLTNMSDTNLDYTALNSSRFLSLYKTFQGELRDLNFMLFFSTSNKFNLKPNSSLLFSSKESLFYKCVDSDKLLNSHSYVLKASLLRSLPFLFQKEFNTVINRNLTLGKENKWLMKNTLLSYDLVTKTLSTTHLKKLYGNSQFNSNIANTNIWISNHLSQASNFTKTNTNKSLNSVNILKMNALNTSSLTHLGNLEESFFWLVKRFKFLQTTSTYYQFNTRNNVSTNLIESKDSSFYTNINEVLKNIALTNTISIDTYNTHLFNESKNNSFKELDQIDTILDLSSQRTFNEFDLSFSKYLFNNLTLQKNALLVYSNLDH